MLCGDTSNQAVEICYIEYISPYTSICMQILLEVVNKPKKKRVLESASFYKKILFQSFYFQMSSIQFHLKS